MKRLLSTIAIFGASVTMTFGQVPDVMEDVNKVVDNTPDSIAKALMARPKPGTTPRTAARAVSDRQLDHAQRHAGQRQQRPMGMGIF